MLHSLSCTGCRELVTFDSTDKHGLAVYHTNVMMAIGTDVVVVAADSVDNPKEKQQLLSRLQQHHEVLPHLIAAHYPCAPVYLHVRHSITFLFSCSRLVMHCACSHVIVPALGPADCAS